MDRIFCYLEDRSKKRDICVFAVDGIVFVFQFCARFSEVRWWSSTLPHDALFRAWVRSVHPWSGTLWEGYEGYAPDDFPQTCQRLGWMLTLPVLTDPADGVVEQFLNAFRKVGENYNVLF